MRLIGLVLFVIVGVLSGWLVHWILGRNSSGLGANMIAGVVGAFAGLFVKDLADIQLTGNVTGALIFALVGALLVAGIVNLVLRDD